MWCRVIFCYSMCCYVSYRTILCYTVLYYAALSWTILYYTVLVLVLVLYLYSYSYSYSYLCSYSYSYSYCTVHVWGIPRARFSVCVCVFFRCSLCGLSQMLVDAQHFAGVFRQMWRTFSAQTTHIFHGGSGLPFHLIAFSNNKLNPLNFHANSVDLVEMSSKFSGFSGICEKAVQWKGSPLTLWMSQLTSEDQRFCWVPLRDIDALKCDFKTFWGTSNGPAKFWDLSGSEYVKTCWTMLKHASV